MKLIENWKYAWQLISVQVGLMHSAAQTSLVTALALMSEQNRMAFIGQHAMQWVWFTMGATFLQTFGRLVQQPAITPPEPKA